jgi:hypothetical protein
MGMVFRFPLERRRALRDDRPASAETGRILVLPVVRVEHHDLPAPPALTVEPPHKGGNKPKRGRKSA